MAYYTITLNTLLYKMNPAFDLQLNEYPVVDEAYRATLNKLIIDTYRFHEIGYETPEMFRHFLKNKLNTIMPRYNLLIEAQRDMDKPLTDYERSGSTRRTVDEDTTQNMSVDETTTNNGTTNVDETQTRNTTIDSDTVVNASSDVNTTVTETLDQDVDTTENKYQVESDTAQSQLVGSVAGQDGYASKIVKEDNDSVVATDSTRTNVTDSNVVDQSTTAIDTTDDTVNVIDGETVINSTTVKDGDNVTVTNSDLIEETTRDEFGRNTSQGLLYKYYSEALEGINSQILDDLEDLFHGLYM